MLTLSLRDRDRLAVLRQVEEGLITPKAAAERLGMSARQLRRLRRRHGEEGDAAVIHGLRGRRSNHALPRARKARALERAREKVFSDFGPTLLAEHLSKDAAIGALNPHTLRRWMIEAGLWTPRRRGRKHRKSRPRREALGELIQWDSSEHAWLEDRAPGRQVLIQMHDDATNRLMMARFVPRDNGAVNRQIAIDYLHRHGRPVAFYTDQAGHFGQHTRPVSTVPLEEREAKRTQSIIRTALETLNVELILAHSPQAKGRVERNFGTSQDRLVKEMRVRGISALEEANRFLDEIYVPFWNERFAVEPAVDHDAHRPLPRDAHLERLFSETCLRSIANDFTIRYKNRRFQIPEAQAEGIQPGQKLTVELRLDGSTHFWWRERELDLEPVRPLPKAGPRQPTTQVPKKSKPPKGARPHPMPPKPGPDHPWRRTGALLAKPLKVARLRSTSAAARPTPPSPQDAGADPSP
ncbi:MAG: ISNCY family transposase [Gemmatimonadota bacterium]